MNKASLFALEYRLELISKADALDSLDSNHDFCRGFLFALLSAQVVSEAEFEDLSDRVNSAVIEARERICQAITDSAADLLVGVENEESEQVSVPVASSRLSVCSVQDWGYFKFTQQLHPNNWSPWGLYLQARDGLFPCWPPLPGKRALVRGESKVCLPSGQASA